MSTGSVLFVRCVPVPLAIEALRTLRRACPQARVDVLTSPGSAPQIERSGLADAVVPYAGRHFGLAQAGARLIVAMRRTRYDMVVVPLTPRGPEAFWNVARIALLFGGRRTVWQPARAAPDGSAAEWPAISLRSWWTSRSSGARWRAALAGALAVPALALAWMVAMVALTIVAAVLVPLVWLAPGDTR